MLIQNNFGEESLYRNDREVARELKDLTTEPSQYTGKKADTKRGKMMIQDKKSPDSHPDASF